MTDSHRRGRGRGAVAWLTVQSLVFGAMAALLGIVANALFLDAYGSGWLPATYIAIGAAGIVVSGAVARTAQRFDLLGIAVSVLGSAAVALGVAWLIARDGGAAWVSVPLLVLFPILVQLGFVFIGGQAGRLLDIAGIKASFPRIVAGFPVGAVIGGIAGGQLVTAFGRTEDLLLATTLAQAALTGLVLATGRRFAADLRSIEPAGPPPGRRTDEHDGPGPTSLRALLSSRFVVLILAYQVLSALGSQLADFLVFDRATAQFQNAADLARFLAGYTAAMNVASIAFLVLVAGPLLRRFGLRLGIAANPLVLTVFAVGMVAGNAIGGAASLALLAIVSAARIADIALTDGTTRTSINAIYQVLPERARLSVQTAVEGIGVPVAIGISGVLILVLNALPFALTATIAVTVLACAIWTWVGVVLYRAYGPALVGALHRQPLLVEGAGLDASAEDEVAAVQLLSSRDARAARLGLDLVSVMASPGLAAELAGLARDDRPEVRLAALAALAGAGDDAALRRLPGEIDAGATSASPEVRLQAARALAAVRATDRGPGRASLAVLLDDEDAAIRTAALVSIQAGDVFAVPAAIAALHDPRTSEAASGAVGRLGDAAVPSIAAALDSAALDPSALPAGPLDPVPPGRAPNAALDESASPASAPVMRLVRAATTPTSARDAVLRQHVGHPDRELALAVAERIVAPEPASEETAAALDAALLDDARHAMRILVALAALDPGGVGGAGEPRGVGGAGEPRGAGGAGEPRDAGGAGEPRDAGGAGEPRDLGAAGEPRDLGAAGEPRDLGDAAGRGTRGALDDHAATDAPLRRALRDELDLVRHKVTAGRLARHGSARLGPVLVELADGPAGAAEWHGRDRAHDQTGARGALAHEALGVLLSPDELKLALPLLEPGLSSPERLARMPAELATDSPDEAEGWLRDLVEDAGRHWRSTWLRACAVYAAKARGLLDRIDLGPARAIGDPIIDEALDGSDARP